MKIQEILIRFPFIKQIIKFFAVGVMNTGIDLVVLNALMFASGETQGVYYSFFKALSFFAAVVFSYYINKNWTFRDSSSSDSQKKFYQFIAISIIGAFINVGVASLVVNFIKPMIGLGFLTGQLWGNIGALCGTAIGLFWNFVGYKFIVFKK